nr:GntR family transcriptional regulator [uncultured Pseudomonas sp.]
MKIVDPYQHLRLATRDVSPPRSITSLVFHKLRKAILLGQFEPCQKLSAGHLSEHYEISLGAVREALARLAAEGLVESQDHRGFRIAGISKEELLDLTETRINVESLALRISIERGDQAWLDNASAAYQAMRQAYSTPFVEAEHRSALHLFFHMALLEGCNSPCLMRFCTTMFERAERYRKLSAAYSKSSRDVEREHEIIFNAVMDRDADTAIAALSQHIQETTNALLQAESESSISIFELHSAKK